MAVTLSTLVAFPCGHTRIVRLDDPQLEFEPDGVRIRAGVHYCHTCYQQRPRVFTWLEPDQMFVYIDLTKGVSHANLRTDFPN